MTGGLRDLPDLLEALNPEATLVERHLWLIALFEWLRGDCRSVAVTLARLQLLLDAAQARPVLRQRIHAWWCALLNTLDGTTLLADFGFAPRNAFASELAQRIGQKLLPQTPETGDAAALFSLALCHEFDAQWLAALDETMLVKLAALLRAPEEEPVPALSPWQTTLLEALIFCTSQVRAAGFSPELRLRMSAPARSARPFHALTHDGENLCDAYQASCGRSTPELVRAAAQLKDRLEACRQAAASVYTHLDAHGISVNLVFQLRQLRERVLRIRMLLDCLLSAHPMSSTVRLLVQLVNLGQERRSVRALISANSSMLAAKVTERSSEVGEHYITRTRAEYGAMLSQAAGGGAVTALTTWMKFGVAALGFSAFWSGWWAGVGYAASFVLIQLLHFTLATKQPAMTAPAMAAKLKDLSQPQALHAFADEVTHLVRSQVAAVLGNVGLVFPVVVVLSLALQYGRGQPMLNATEAAYVLHSLTLLGPTALFAAFTGVLLFASSLIAGWSENWFVLQRLDSALCYHPRITRYLGAARARAWADFMRRHVSGFASNVSLGLMLGLIPAFADFFGLGLEARHVTLSAGQLAAACATLGWNVLREPALWWCIAAIPVMGALNLLVSFYLAFRLALRAHNVTDLARAQITAHIWQRWRDAPLSFFWPQPDPQELPHG